MKIYIFHMTKNVIHDPILFIWMTLQMTLYIKQMFPFGFIFILSFIILSFLQVSVNFIFFLSVLLSFLQTLLYTLPNSTRNYLQQTCASLFEHYNETIKSGNRYALLVIY